MKYVFWKFKNLGYTWYFCIVISYDKINKTYKIRPYSKNGQPTSGEGIEKTLKELRSIADPISQDDLWYSIGLANSYLE